MTITGARSAYHNLELDKQSSYLTTTLCYFVRYRFTRLPFGVAPAGDMFLRKFNEAFKGLSNLFDLTGGIQMVGYEADDRDHDRIQRQVVQICC